MYMCIYIYIYLFIYLYVCNVICNLKLYYKYCAALEQSRINVYEERCANVR